MTDARAMRGPYPEPLGVNRSNFAALEVDATTARALPFEQSGQGRHTAVSLVTTAPSATRLIIDTGLVWRDNTSTRF
jgi:hypothetical protein